ncbi:hypothetical protein QAD02_011923 [Eretmocerus hayati]|uniref:Uncharacterized protein n=1 Tax=Eretmocerus hayati TaxID=131215 RepID=A0ACC2P103_9HYME|nr:hypothetical protein QAD02_011923 [Eretmocerus hayati]
MEFGRKPRRLKDYPHFKATEYRLLALYTGPVVSSKYINDEKMLHFNRLNLAARSKAKNKKKCLLGPTDFKITNKLKQEILPDGYVNPHKFIKFSKFTLSKSKPDNCCYLEDGSLVSIKFICEKSNTGQEVILFNEFTNLLPIENYPIDSREIGICKTNNLSDDMFECSNSENNNDKAIVPKTKIAPQSSAKKSVSSTKNSTVSTKTGQVINKQQQNEQYEVDDSDSDMNDCDYNELREGIANGKISLRKLLQSKSMKDLSTSKETSTTNEVESEEELSDSQDNQLTLFDTKLLSPSPSMVSLDGGTRSDDYGMDDTHDQSHENSDGEVETVETEQVDGKCQNQVSLAPELASEESQSIEPNIMVLNNTDIDLSGVKMKLQDFQDVLHSENCCSPCRQTFSIMLEKVNLIIEKLRALSQVVIAMQNAQMGQVAQVGKVPVLNTFKPENYPLMPKFTLKTEIDLVTFNSLLEENVEAQAQFMNLISCIRGKNPGDEVRNILDRIIDDQLAYKSVVISHWDGVKDEEGRDVVIPVEFAMSIMQDWFRRTSTRIARKNEKKSKKNAKCKP